MPLQFKSMSQTVNEQNVENINIEKPQILVTPAELK